MNPVIATVFIVFVVYTFIAVIASIPTMFEQIRSEVRLRRHIALKKRQQNNQGDTE